MDDCPLYMISVVRKSMNLLVRCELVSWILSRENLLTKYGLELIYSIRNNEDNCRVWNRKYNLKLRDLLSFKKEDKIIVANFTRCVSIHNRSTLLIYFEDARCSVRCIVNDIFYQSLNHLQAENSNRLRMISISRLSLIHI